MRLANQEQLNVARYLQGGFSPYEMVTLMGCVLGRRAIHIPREVIEDALS